MARGEAGRPADWVTRAADDAIRHAGREQAGRHRAPRALSPSGPVHLGNLREFLTVHFVADELRRRGVPVRHLHVWDDYDRFRKVPAGVDASWAEHIGRPLSAVPDPWECHASWAEHFKAPLRDALHEMGVDMEEISQTERYTSGVYRDQVLHAVATATTSTRCSRATARRRRRRRRVRAGGRGARRLGGRRRGGRRRGRRGELARFPFKPYCRECGRDTTTSRRTTTRRPTSPTPASRAAFTGVTNLATQNEGKLVWKVDWPMRWAFENVDFEPAGMDHATPGLVVHRRPRAGESVFGMPRPAWFGYGVRRLRRHAEDVVLARAACRPPGDALVILEAPILRWLYVRRKPKQTFNIDFGPEVVRLYDEWDALGRKAADPAQARPAGARLRARRRDRDRRRAAHASGGRAVPDALLGGRRDRRVGRADQPDRRARRLPPRDRDELEPRLAQGDGVDGGVRAAEDRTIVRAEPDTERLGVADRAGGALARRCCSTTCPTSSTSSRSPRWSTACPSSRTAWPRRRPDRRGQGRPEGVLPAALQPAGRQGPRPAAADAGRGAGRREGAVAQLDGPWSPVPGWHEVSAYNQ